MAEHSQDPSSSSAGTKAPEDEAQPPSRRLWPWLLTMVFLALLLGLLTNPVVRQWLGGQLFPDRQADTPVSAVGAGAPERGDGLPAGSDRLSDLERRVDLLEQKNLTQELEVPGNSSPPVPSSALERRIASLEAQAANLVAADVGLTSRVEAIGEDMQQVRGSAQTSDRQVRELFLLSLVRRLITTGQTISPLNDLLERTYGQQYPGAVQALSAWAASPRRRSNLSDRLANLALAPSVTAGQGWWSRFRRQLSGLLAANRPGQPDGAHPRDALAAAQAALAGGDLEAAIRAVEQLPAGDARDNWVRDARTLLHAEQALDMLEESAVGRMIDVATAVPEAERQPPVNAPEILSAIPAG